jgi:hypothetical protein
MSAPTAELFDRVSDILRSIGQEKQAAARKSASDPGGLDGASTHPSAKAQNCTVPVPEGFQTAANKKIVKDTIPGGGTDGTSDMTAASAPKAEAAQMGDAKPTGEEPSIEDNYQATSDDKDEGGFGGTSHPANAGHAKCSAEHLAAASDDELFKLAAELGNALAADLANSANLAPVMPAKQAAAAGAAVAAATNVDEDEVAANIITQIVKMADHQADLIASYLASEAKLLKRAADEEADEQAEEHTEPDADNEGGPSDADADNAGGDSGAAADLLASMGGGGAAGGPPPGMEAGGPPGAEGGMPPGMEGGMPPGAEGGMPGAGGPGDEEAALQQLAMALMELGIDPAALAQVAAGTKMASAVSNFKASGKFKFTEAKQGSEARHIRDYMKDHIKELLVRSQG